MARHYYSTTAVSTTLTSGISNSATTMAVGSTTGFPGSFPYYLVLEKGTANMEVVDVTSAVGLTLTVTRGVSGTTGLAHSSGTAVEHDAPSDFFNESSAADANARLVALGAMAPATGILVEDTAGPTFTRRALASTSTGLVVTNGSGVAGNPSLALDAGLQALSVFNTNGLLTQTANDAFAGRALAVSGTGLSIVNGNGVAGDPTVTLAPFTASQDFSKYVPKTADETLTTSTTFQADNHIAGVSFAASQTWLCELYLEIETTTTGMFKSQWSVTGGATITARHVYGNPTSSSGTPSANTESSAQVRAAGDSVSNKADTSTSISTSYRETIKVVTSGSTGTITFEWAQNSSAGDTTVKGGTSWLTARRVE